MTDFEDEPRRMTLEELAVIRQVIEWRRSVGASFFLNRGGHRFAGPYGFAEWRMRVKNHRHVIAVAFERETPDVLVFTTNHHINDYQHITIETPMQAIGVLVAVGILPARFSPAYRAGWDARASYTPDDGPTPGVLVRLGGRLQDAPAVGATW